MKYFMVVSALFLLAVACGDGPQEVAVSTVAPAATVAAPATSTPEGGVLLPTVVGAMAPTEVLGPTAPESTRVPTRVRVIVTRVPETPVEVQVVTPTLGVLPAEVAPILEVAPVGDLGTGEEIFAASVRAMEEVESGHYDASIVSTVVEDGEEFEVRMTGSGDFEMPDREHSLVRWSVGGVMMVEFEVIMVDGQIYAKDPLSGAWEVDTEYMGVMESVLDFPAVGLGSVVEMVGEELLEDRLVYYLRGTAGGYDVMEILEHQGLAVGPAEVEYWIGVDDLLFYRARVVVKGLAGVADNARDGVGVEVVMDLSDYGKEVDIQVPEVVVPEGEGTG